MKRNGRTQAHTQRWHCKECGALSTHGNDISQCELRNFSGWFLTRSTMRYGGRGTYIQTSCTEVLEDMVYA